MQLLSHRTCSSVILHQATPASPFPESKHDRPTSLDCPVHIAIRPSNRPFPTLTLGMHMREIRVSAGCGGHQFMAQHLDIPSTVFHEGISNGISTPSRHGTP